MALSARQIELQSITKFKKTQISLLKNGARIEHICADTISNLLLSASADRFRLAKEFLKSAERMSKSRPRMERSCISRSYYGMYHAARAIAFVHHEGDDNEAHQDLHKGIPDDFPDQDQWKNSLKEARLRRNEADYDPYPIDDADFTSIRQRQLPTVIQFIDLVETYLRARGCPV